MPIMAPISVGELLDKITILQIKSNRIRDAAKLVNVGHELDQLWQVYHTLYNQFNASPVGLSALIDALTKVNNELWDIENYKRSCEQDQSFGVAFIDAARQVYLKNDERARIKREINLLAGSTIVEEKCHDS